MWSPTKEKVKKIRRRGRTGRTDRRRQEELVVLEAVWSWFWRQSGAGKNKLKKKAVLEAGSSLELAKKIGSFAADVVVHPVGEDKKMK